MFVDYVGHLGSDLTVVNAARVSFDKESQLHEGELADRDKRLIGYLASHDHFTPFTHVQVTLRETVPIFVARQRFKHAVGFSYNEVSRRYVDSPPEFYCPGEWRLRPTGSVKQGSADAHPNTVAIQNTYGEFLCLAKKLYEGMIADGVAPEQARMVLPQSMFTSYYVTGSLAAYARLYRLRSTPHAQQEIQELGRLISGIVGPLFPVSWKALTGLEVVSEH